MDTDARPLRAFLREVACFVALQAALFAGVQARYLHVYFEDHYLDAWIDKHRRLDETPPPRVLLCGGSNVAFGFDSSLMARLVGRPVVNLGLNAALGREFILREAEAAARPGDLVVLSLEYTLLSQADDVPDVATLLDLATRAPRAVRFFSPAQAPRMLDHAIAYFAKRPRGLALEAWNGRPEANAVYSRRAFNAEGDNQAHWTAQAPPGLRRRAGLSGAPPALIVPRLNAFARRVRDAGARAFLSLPPVPPEDLVRQAPNFAFLCSTLRTELDMPLIQPSVQAYPHEMFFDTAYHLSLPGGRRQTREVAARLLAELERQPAVSR